MCLLRLFADQSKDRDYGLVVAHFDHGMRAESSEDAALVADTAATLGLIFVGTRAALSGASEANARAARYKWLDQVRRDHKAAAIITAHHEDDLLETSLLNLARGTSRQGLAPMLSRPVVRPLINVTKLQLHAYALDQNITWHEDVTNQDRANPRNLLRHELLPYATAQWRHDYLEAINELEQINRVVNLQLAIILDEARTSAGYELRRPSIRDLSLDELAELILCAARRLEPAFEGDERLLQELALFTKTGTAGRRRPLSSKLEVAVGQNTVAIRHATTPSP